jgi:hypothetical protein
VLVELLYAVLAAQPHWCDLTASWCVAVFKATQRFTGRQQLAYIDMLQFHLAARSAVLSWQQRLGCNMQNTYMERMVARCCRSQTQHRSLHCCRLCAQVA